MFFLRKIIIEDIFWCITDPQDAISFTHGPATKEVDLEVVVEDNDDMLCSKLVHRSLVGV